MNEGNLIFFFVIERYWWVEWDYYKKKNQKSEKEQGEKWKWNFLSTLFRNKYFISQESPILADVEDINFWSRIETLSGFIEVVDIAVYNHLVRLSLKYGLDGIFSMVNLKNSSWK